ncbi:MAG: protein-L-isoaspartate(D-aspartate) O-methyltransferase, partial [Solirubrobacteraceae bacterium]|nr:protein-L-isoaspartate(D-aspartate) O-methyltransferase [Solirubrobacteraceae bacterium]
MSEAARLVAELRPYVGDERVLDAIARVPREAFVPPELRANAYENTALGSGCGPTISQPLVVAR